MSVAYRVKLTKNADKELQKIARGDIVEAKKISIFITEILHNSSSPTLLKNCKKMVGYDNLYRWHIGNYRLIGTVINKILTIEIIKIATRQGAY